MEHKLVLLVWLLCLSFPRLPAVACSWGDFRRRPKEAKQAGAEAMLRDPRIQALLAKNPERYLKNLVSLRLGRIAGDEDVVYSLEEPDGATSEERFIARAELRRLGSKLSESRG